jgi:hypothetical protein
VGIASSCFKAAMAMLDPVDLPMDMLRDFLHGMSRCSNEEFKASCSMQVAVLGSPMYTVYAALFPGATGPLQMLEAFASKLEIHSDGLILAKKLTGHSAKDSFFPARDASPTGRSRGDSPRQQTRDTIPHQQGQLVDPDPKWQRWWKSQTCEICGGNHPTRYHDDKGKYSRKYVPFKKSLQRTQAASPANRSQTGSLRFKPGGKGKFIKKAYNILVENVEEEDQELLANIMDDFGAEDDETEPLIGGEDGESEGANALAAMGLDQLMNWWLNC